MKVMKVGDLRKLLKNYNDDLPVHLIDERAKTDDEIAYDIFPSQIQLDNEEDENDNVQYFVGIHFENKKQGNKAVKIYY